MTISVQRRNTVLAELLAQKREEHRLLKKQLVRVEQEYDTLKSAFDELNEIHNPFKQSEED